MLFALTLLQLYNGDAEAVSVLQVLPSPSFSEVGITIIGFEEVRYRVTCGDHSRIIIEAIESATETL